MNNFTQRILTAIVLLPLVLFLAFKTPSSWFGYFLILVILMSFYEFFKLAKTSNTNKIIIAIIAILLNAIIVLSTAESPLIILPLLSILFFWLKNTYLIFNYPHAKPSKNNFFSGVNGVFLLIPLAGLWLLNNLGHKDYLLLLFLIVWGADSFAYLIGKAFGKHKLAVKISNGKTIEGLIGGLIGAITLTLLWLIFNDISSQEYFKYIILAIITAIFSVFGDLYESIYKREASVKDSGNILPGHGGILDRIDGLLGATPIFMLGLAFV